jgi:hypothetical protein
VWAHSTEKTKAVNEKSKKLTDVLELAEHLVANTRELVYGKSAAGRRIAFFTLYKEGSAHADCSGPHGRAG